MDAVVVPTPAFELDPGSRAGETVAVGFWLCPGRVRRQLSKSLVELMLDARGSNRHSRDRASTSRGRASCDSGHARSSKRLVPEAAKRTICETRHSRVIRSRRGLGFRPTLRVGPGWCPGRGNRFHPGSTHESLLDEPERLRSLWPGFRSAVPRKWAEPALLTIASPSCSEHDRKGL